MATSHAFSNEGSRPYAAILWAGLVAGVLDLTAALVTNSLRGLRPLRILLVVHMLCVGLPIALVIRRFRSRY